MSKRGTEPSGEGSSSALDASNKFLCVVACKSPGSLLNQGNQRGGEGEEEASDRCTEGDSEGEEEETERRPLKNRGGGGGGGSTAAEPRRRIL